LRCTTWIEPFKKPQHLRPAHRFAHNNFSHAVDGVDLINVLGQIEADGGNFHGGWLPSLVVASSLPRFGTLMPGAGAIHPICFRRDRTFAPTALMGRF
jgi:hypothetical protein